MKFSFLLVLAVAVALLGVAFSQDPSSPSPPTPSVIASTPAPPTPSPPSNPTPPADDVPPNLSKEAWDWIKRGMFIALILVGLAWCFAGYRLFKPVLFTAGFVAFFFITIEILTTTTRAPIAGWISLAISAAVGIIGGVLMILVFKVGVFLIGFIAGALLAMLAVSFTQLSTLIMTNVAASWSFWVFLACVVGLGVLVGVAGLFFVKHVVIVASGVSGAIMIGLGADRLIPESVHPVKVFDVLHYAFQGFGVPSKVISGELKSAWPTWVILAGILVFAVGGVFVQYKWTSQNFSHEPEQKPKGTGEEEFPLLIQNM